MAYRIKSPVEFWGTINVRPNGTTNGPSAFITQSNTVDRTYTLPDASGTLVLTSRNISTSGGISGGGDLSADRTLTLSSIANNTVLGNISGTTNTPVALTTQQLTSILNIVGQSSSLVSGGALSINATDNTKFDVSQVKCIFVDYSVDPLYPTISYFTFGPFTSQTTTYLASAPASYIGINSSGTLVQSNTPFTETQRRDIISLGALSHPTNTVINNVRPISQTGLAVVNQLEDILANIGPLNLAGLVYSPNGANLNVNLSNGEILKLGCNFDADPKDPHTKFLTGGTAISFFYRLQNSTQSASTTSIDPNHYDVGGTLTLVPNNKFTIQYIYIFETGTTRILYGQNVYANISDALAAIGKETFVTESDTANNGILRAYLIVQQGTTALNNTASAQFLALSKFGSPLGGVAGSNLASPTALVGLTAINGTATTGMRSDAAPALDQTIAPTWTGTHTFSKNGIGTTSTSAVVLTNTTAAALGAQQYSPRVRLSGQGWATTPGASQGVDWIAQVVPVQGAANPSSYLDIQRQINGGGYTNAFSIFSSGGATLGSTTDPGNGNFSIFGATNPALTVTMSGGTTTRAVVTATNDTGISTQLISYGSTSASNPNDGALAFSGTGTLHFYQNGNDKLQINSVGSKFLTPIAVMATLTVDVAMNIGGSLTSTSTTQTGFGSQVTPTSSATTSYTAAYYKGASAAAAYTQTNTYGTYVDTPAKGAGSTMTNVYGIYVAAQNQGTTNYAIYTNSGKNFLGDTLGILSTPNNDTALRVSGTLSNSTAGGQTGIDLETVPSSSATGNMIQLYIRNRSATATYTQSAAYAIYIDNGGYGAGSTVTTSYGLYVGSQSGAGTNYAIYTNTGIVRIGDTTATTSGSTGALLVSGGAAINNGFYAAGTGGSNGAFQFQASTSLTSGGNVGTFLVNQATYTGTSTATYSGLTSRSYSQTAGLSGGSFIGGSFEARLFSGATGTISELNSIRGNINNASTSTVTSAEGLYVTSAINSGGGTITTLYGIKIDDQTVGSTNYSIYTGLGPISLGDSVTIRNGSFTINGAVASNLQATLTSGASDANFQLRARNGSGSTASTEQARFGLEYATNGMGAGLSFYRGTGSTDGSLHFITNTLDRGYIDSAGQLIIGNNVVMGTVSGNPEHGSFNTLWPAISAGKPAFADEEFSNGSTAISLYDNSGGGHTTLTREQNAAAVNISTASWASNVLSITTSAAHGLTTNDTFVVENVTPSAYNGTYVVLTAPTTTTLTATLLTNPGTYTSGGTTRKPSIPNHSGWRIKIAYDGAGTAGTNPTPGFGGFFSLYTSAQNRIVVHRFRAMIPTGYTLQVGSNSQGANSNNYWLTSNTGTGKYEEYAYVFQVGNTGTVGSMGFVFILSGVSGAPTNTTAFNWYIASTNIYEVETSGIADMLANGFTSSGTITGNILTAGSGSAAAPSITLGDSTTGIYRPASNQLGFTIAGVETVQIDASSGLTISGNIGRLNVTKGSSTGILRIAGGSNELLQFGPAGATITSSQFGNGAANTTLGAYVDTLATGALNFYGNNATLFGGFTSAGLFNFATTTDASSTTSASVTVTGGLGVAKQTYLGDELHLAASTTTRASINIPTGTAPTTPSNGDIWYTANAFHFYQNGVDTTLGTGGGYSLPTTMAGASASPTWVKYTFAYTALSAAATSNAVTIDSLPAGGVIHAIKIKHSTAFAGTGITAYTIGVGTGGSTTLTSDYNVFQTVASNTFYMADTTLATYDNTSTTTIQVIAKSTGANLSSATAGSVDIWLLVSKAV